MSAPKIEKVLIANRGEIAMRVARTCRRLGIGTVAVYSDPDARSQHVRAADEAVALGGTTGMESYLVKEKIIEAAKRADCQAIHPGYGFLSENPVFAKMVADAGMIFVGPPAKAIELMGDKMTSKKLATSAGVPTVPGLQEPVATEAAAIAAASDIGYPVLLKPSAGGGGKGMRIVHEEGEIGAALQACMAEAAKAFGDDRVFVERYVDRPRHVEIQVLADAAGNIIHLGERECSIQRRYQKVIEEAPSPALDPELRARMGASACDLARAAGYVSAGTVEFILGSDRSFYFLEMNTRIQVEHPVTELITGLDLVEMQLRIASGESLPLGQDDVRLDGWAIEARICAEDPDRGFIPSTGPITRYEEPRGQHLRVDSGVAAGSYISVYYDSMLAKIVAHGATREEARRSLIDGLNGYHIEGPSTNVDFCNAILNHQAFASGDLSTDFIKEHMEQTEDRPPPPVTDLHHMAIAAAIVYHNRQSLVAESLKPMAPHSGGVREPERGHDYVVKAGADEFRLRLEAVEGLRHWSFTVDGTSYDVEAPDFEFYRRRLRLVIGGARQRFVLRYEGNFIRAAHNGLRRTFEIYEPREWKLAQYMPEPTSEEDSTTLLCPMPGMVVDVHVAPGDQVYAGQVLVTLESMKMESGVSAPRDTVIKSVGVTKGAAVEADTVLIEFEE